MVEATLDGSDNGASAGSAAGAAIGAAVERGVPLAVARAVGARRVVGRARERGGSFHAPCPMRGARSTAVALCSARSSMSIGDMGDENPNRLLRKLYVNLEFYPDTQYQGTRCYVQSYQVFRLVTLDRDLARAF